MPISIIAQMALLERLRNWPDDVVWCWVALDALELCAPVSRETLNFPSLPESNNYLESINTTRPSKDPLHTQLFCHCPPRVIDLLGPSLTKSLTICIYILCTYVARPSILLERAIIGSNYKQKSILFAIPLRYEPNEFGSGGSGLLVAANHMCACFVSS